MEDKLKEMLDMNGKYGNMRHEDKTANMTDDEVKTALTLAEEVLRDKKKGVFVIFEKTEDAMKGIILGHGVPKQRIFTAIVRSLELTKAQVMAMYELNDLN